MKRSMSFALVVALWFAYQPTSAQLTAELENPSFETGDFTSWVPADPLAGFLPLGVYASGSFTAAFPDIATDGAFYAGHDFGDALFAGTRSVAQGLLPGPCVTGVTFDWRTARLGSHGDPAPRVFRVDIEPLGGGAALQSDVLLTIPAGAGALDTGLVTSTVDLTPFAGAGGVRISFEWDHGGFIIPGGQPASHFLLDNIRLEGVGQGTETARFGVPPNPGTLLPGATGPPIIGMSWMPTVTGVPSVIDVIIVDPQGSMINVALPFGTLLCNLPSPSFFFFGGPGTPISIPIPNDCTLVGRTGCAQGAGLTFMPLTLTLTNALDTVIGTM